MREIDHMIRQSEEREASEGIETEDIASVKVGREGMTIMKVADIRMASLFKEKV